VITHPSIRRRRQRRHQRRAWCPSEPTKEPFVGEMALPQARAAHASRRPTRAFVNPAEPGKPASQGGQRSLSHLGSARRARQQRTGGHGLANADCVAAEVTERDPPRPGVGPCRLCAPSGRRIWRCA
jgi:hypothetical protein